MTADTDQQPKERDRLDVRRLVVSVLVTLLVLAVSLFVPAGTLAWAKGWIFVGVLILLSIVLVFYLQRVNPEVIVARTNRHKGTKWWDRIVILFLLYSGMAIPIVAALDDGRFHWFPLPLWVCGLGYVLLVLGMAGVAWAESVNKFFEPTVRIQSDRNHKVVDTGPYAIVRHPGYASALPLIVGVAFVLGSVWALIPAVLAYTVLIVRTVLEDRMLREELPGYQAYAERVRYRLVPGIW
jgi:protein-S-isoprenylcysteine O-methyltransferase Ste14